MSAKLNSEFKEPTIKIKQDSKSMFQENIYSNIRKFTQI